MRKILPPLIVSAIIIIALRVLSLFSFEHSQIIYSAASVVLLLVGSFVLKLFSEKKVRLIRFFKLRFSKTKDIPIIFWMTVTVITSSFMLNLFSLNLFKTMGLNVEGNVLAAYDTENLLLSVLTLAVSPAIFEEIFFRGAALSVLSKEKKASAIIISAFLFACAHGSLYMFFSSFFAGIIFGITVYLTDSIFTSMLTHFLNNIMVYILFTYSNLLSEAGFDDMLIFATVLLFLISVYGAITVTARRYKKDLRENKPIVNEGEIIWEKIKEKRSSKKS